MKAHPLKIERERRGWSQSKVAELLGTTTRTIIRWEQGKVVPYSHYREQLCAIFGKTAQQLGLATDDPRQGLYKDEESMQLELDFPPETLMSFSQSRSLQEAFLLDPTIPQMLGRAESLLGQDLLLAQIKQRLLNADSPPLMALHGLPGIGKTALAVASAFDPQIQARFYDGILWAELGPQPNVLGQLARWGSLLNIPPSHVEHLQSREAWSKTLQAAIGQRNLLIVIDDAWTAQDAFAFRVGGPYCTHLLTTRLPQVAFTFAEENVLSIPELEDADSLALLARFIPQLIEQDPEAAQSLILIAGGLPLGLVLMGKYLAIHALTQQPRRLQAALAQIHDTKQRLRVTVPMAPTERMANLSADTPPSLYTTIAVSDQQLSPQAHATLRALAIFPPKPATFSEEAALAISQQPVEILDELWDTGLLESCGAGRYSLHQTIIDYARTLNDDATAEELQANSLDSTIHQNKQKIYALIASLFDWQGGSQKQEGPTFFRRSKLSLQSYLSITAVIILATILISMTLPQVFTRQAPSPTPMITSYGPPLYTLNIQNTDPSFNDITSHLQNAFKAVYPQLVNRFALDPASDANKPVTLTLAQDLSSPATTNSMTITINSNWIRQHPNDMGLLTHELTLLVQAYPSGAPTWFSNGMADYARSIYGPADDEWSLPEHVQPQDSYTQGGPVAAGFLSWLEQHTTLAIVDQLNHALQTRQSFSAVFHRLTHHTVNELWKQYQAHPAIALTPQQIYQTATSRKPLLYHQSPVDVQCIWQGGLHFEYLEGLFMSNFAMQADMTFMQGDGGGGFFFRNPDNQTDSLYRFRVSPDGTYDLVYQSHALTTSLTPLVKPGPHQTIRLTIIAQQRMIYIYINGQLMIQTDDSGSRYGTIGEMAYSKSSPTDAVRFENIQVF